MKTIGQSHYRLTVSFIGFILWAEIFIAEAQQNQSGNSSRLEAPMVNITFDSRDGLPLRYDLKKLKGQFRGKEEGRTIKVMVRKSLSQSGISFLPVTNKTGNGEIYIPGKTDTVIIPVMKRTVLSKNMADIGYEGYLDNLRIVAFTIRYSIKDQTVFLTLEDVTEQNGYELVEIQTSSLVSVAESDGVTWLAHGDGGGYYTDMTSARTCTLKDGWSKDFPYFPNFTYLPLVIMGNGKVNTSMEVQGYLSNTQLEVFMINGKKGATMGVKSFYRVKGESITSLLVEQNEICRIDFTGDYDRNKITDWLDAAKIVRDRMPPTPTHYYDDRMVWIISGQPGRTEKATITFPDIEKVIAKICRLTDGVPQAVYVSGWTEGGHDTGYPSITKLNEKMGGMPGFFQLKERAIQYNANISFDDNYDDQFNNEYTQGHFDKKYIAINADGTLMQQRAWNGVDMSHITGMAKYMTDGGPGPERVRFTCQAYGLKQTELVDAVTWWSIRNDWDPESPASAVKNLRDGKFKLISEYEKYGVYIISELLRYPFVGKLALVVDGPDGGGWNGFGGTQIPLQRLVYSKSIIYGPGGGDGVARDPRLTLLHNSRRGPWIAENTPGDDITNYYYLNFLPWTKLHALDILSFQRDNQSVTMDLSNKSSVKIDYSTKDSFSAVYDGIQIMDGNSITCPIDNNRIAFYSKTEKTLTYPVPDLKNKALFKAKVLYEDRLENFPFKIDNGKIEITVPAGRPVILSIE
jgi:hypothetical protein